MADGTSPEQGGRRAEPGPAVDTALEAELEAALLAARTELSRIRGNLALVADFLTRPEH
ncbi:MAG: hypothetical protein KDB40_22225 [Acidimicrobiales bacterium]|nr:hypothetical protein [Acidimicrobiales bacterium]MCB9394889.1 hypothetical protein [Acidimicrobiaceae bacterium]